MSRFRTVCFYLKRFSAFFANICNLCVFHNTYYSTLFPAYVAVALERWATLTGKTPVKIEA
jgi:hypothetical protein